MDRIGSVVIDGFYGYRNAGDEAILAAIIQQIRSHDPEARVIVSSSDPTYTRSLHDVDDCILRWTPGDGLPSLTWLSTILQADQFWIGGGGLFGDRKMLKYALPTVLARTAGTRVATIGVGSGPFASSDNRLAASTLSHCAALTVRDEETATRLRSLGVSDPIDVCADPVFGYEIETEDIGFPVGLDEYVGENTILVSVREPSDRGIDEQSLAEALSVVATELNANIVFVPFHGNRTGAKSDVDIARQVTTHMERTDPIVWEDELTFRQLMAATKRSRVVVGMRLHSLIFAARMRTPFVGLPYAPKCVAHLNRLMAQTSFSCDDIDSTSLSTEIQMRWEEGIPPEMKTAIGACESQARQLVPTILTRDRACSRLRIPELIARAGVNGVGKVVSE